MFNDSQFGFRSGRSTIDALVHIDQLILEALEVKKSTCAILCDLSKAFDTISHEILALKLKYYGIANNELDLIKSYLDDRKQVVVVNGNISQIKTILSGVPQGSVLGPILFLIYINDFSRNLTSNSILFADDTRIMITHKDMDTLNGLTRIALNEANIWFSSNKLKLNNEKMQRIFFSISTNNDLQNNVKLLGLNIDSKLSGIFIFCMSHGII